jgi:hypothetical protein
MGRGPTYDPRPACLQVADLALNLLAAVEPVGIFQRKIDLEEAIRAWGESVVCVDKL